MRPALLLLHTLLLAAPLGADSLSEAVDRAVGQGTAWLQKDQKPEGCWGDPKDQWAAGRTALSLLALYKSGVQLFDPGFHKGLGFLRYAPIDRTYSAGVTLVLLSELQRPEDVEWMKNLVQFLVTSQRNAPRIWAYPAGEPDLSNTQYACLGLKAAARRGIAVPKETWMGVVEYLVKQQEEDGSWSYRPGRFPSGSMTVAGISNLLICRSELKGHEPFERLRRKADGALERAWKWLDQKFTVDYNPSPTDARFNDWLHYYLYGIERVGIFSGRTEIGGKKWYGEGAEKLLQLQGREGAWGKHEDTCFALLFLRRASFTLGDSAPDVKADLDREAAARKVTVKKVEAPPRPKERVPFLREWLVLGPFPSPSDTLFNEKFIDEEKIAPVAGLRSAKRKWVPAQLAPGAKSIHFKEVIAHKDWAIAYAFAYVNSPEAGEAVLWIGTKDGVRAWWNGEMVLDQHVHRGFGHDLDHVRVRLQAGQNRLLLKVDHADYDWQFSVRVADDEGDPIPGLEAVVRK